MTWKNILKKDSRITSHQRRGKKELDRRKKLFGGNDWQRGMEEVDGEQVASAGKMPRPKPYKGSYHDSNRVRGDYYTASFAATAVAEKFFEKYNGTEEPHYALKPIALKMREGKNDDQIQIELENYLKRVLRNDVKFMKLLESEGVEYRFIDWGMLVESLQPEFDRLSHLRTE